MTFFWLEALWLLAVIPLLVGAYLWLLRRKKRAALRYAAVVVGVMNRLAARDLLPADSMIWRDNPASDCLAMLLEEVGA